MWMCRTRPQEQSSFSTVKEMKIETMKNEVHTRALHMWMCYSFHYKTVHGGARREEVPEHFSWNIFLWEYKRQRHCSGNYSTLTLFMDEKVGKAVGVIFLHMFCSSSWNVYGPRTCSRMYIRCCTFNSNKEIIVGGWYMAKSECNVCLSATRAGFPSEFK